MAYLDVTEEILTAFGMLRAAGMPTAVYLRGSGGARHLQAVEEGELIHGQSVHADARPDLLDSFPCHVAP